MDGLIREVELGVPCPRLGRGKRSADRAILPAELGRDRTGQVLVECGVGRHRAGEGTGDGCRQAARVAEHLATAGPLRQVRAVPREHRAGIGRPGLEIQSGLVDHDRVVVDHRRDVRRHVGDDRDRSVERRRGPRGRRVRQEQGDRNGHGHQHQGGRLPTGIGRHSPTFLVQRDSLCRGQGTSFIAPALPRRIVLILVLSKNVVKWIKMTHIFGHGWRPALTDMSDYGRVQQLRVHGFP